MRVKMFFVHSRINILPSNGVGCLEPVEVFIYETNIRHLDRMNIRSGRTSGIQSSFS